LRTIFKEGFEKSIWKAACRLAIGPAKTVLKDTRTEIVAENMIMLSPKSSSGYSGAPAGNYAPRAAAPVQEQPFANEPIIGH